MDYRDDFVILGRNHESFEEVRDENIKDSIDKLFRITIAMSKANLITLEGYLDDRSRTKLTYV